jgi:hypothetical protein
MFKLGDGIDNGTIDARGLFDTNVSVPEAPFRVAVRSLAPGAQALFLDVMNKLIAAARLPVGPKRTDELKAVERFLDGRDDLEAKAVRLLSPATAHIGGADTRCAALCRVAAAAIACERFRAKHGRLPATLGELPKDLLTTVPLDPHTDDPIRYALTDTGAVVYCTGPDKADDGGILSTKQLPEKGTDLGVRLYRPEHRGAPPEPKRPAEDVRP